VPSASQLKAARERLAVRAAIAKNVDKAKSLREQTAMMRAKLKAMRKR